MKDWLLYIMKILMSSVTDYCHKRINIAKHLVKNNRVRSQAKGRNDGNVQFQIYSSKELSSSDFAYDLCIHACMRACRSLHLQDDIIVLKLTVCIPIHSCANFAVEEGIPMKSILPWATFGIAQCQPPDIFWASAVRMIDMEISTLSMPARTNNGKKVEVGMGYIMPWCLEKPSTGEPVQNVSAFSVES